MKLNTDPFNLAQDNLGSFFCKEPVFSGHIAFSHRTHQKSGVREEKLIIKKTPSGMIRLAAKDGPVDFHAQAVCDLSGINSVFISVSGLIFF